MFTWPQKRLNLNAKLIHFYYFFLLLAAIFATVFSPSIGGRLAETVHMLSGILFLNSLHIVFGLFLFFRHHEISKISSLHRPRIYWGALLLFAIVALVMLIERNWIDKEFSIIMLTLFFAAGRHHGISQTWGLLNIANRTEDEPWIISKNIIYVFLALSILIYYLYLKEKQFYYIALATSLCLQAKIFFDFRKIKNKTFASWSFLARVLLYANAGNNYWFNTACIFFHGIEYLFVFHRLNNSSEKPIKFIEVYASMLFLIPMFMYVHYYSFLNSSFPLLGFDIRNYFYIIVTGKIISFGHYYLDAFIFRMKDDEVRAVVAPLLRG